MPDGIIKKSEVIRYLGYGSNTPDEKTLNLINELIALAEKTLSPKAIHGVFEIADGKICGSDLVLSGKDISAHTNNATKCIIFAATLGTKTEMQLNLFQKTDMEKAVIFDAVCDAYIEAFADNYCEKLRQDLKQNGLYINNRFSPGYGDFSIEKQKDIIATLKSDKLIGLTVTDSFVLLPRKSITAVIGVFDTEPTGKARGCESCNMQQQCKMRGTNKCLRQTDSI